MSNPHSTADPSFDNALNALAVEAEHKIAAKSAGKESSSFIQMLRPLIVGIEAIARSQAETTRMLSSLQEAKSKVTPAEEPSPSAAIQTIHEKLDQKASLNERLFNALHDELRTYKDDFLFDLLQKPIIKDLITLHDDLAALRNHKSADYSKPEASSDREKHLLERVQTFEQNLDHSVHALEEVLARMQVERMEPHPGKLDKRSQKVISVEITNNPDEHDNVLRSLRPGFRWRDRMVRPEEVIIKKYSVPVATNSPG
jgi:molecular chaperone GrpE (heat shock protein)